MSTTPDVTPTQFTSLLTPGGASGTYQRPYPNGTAAIEVSFLKSRPAYTNPNFSNSFANGPNGDGFRPLTSKQIKQAKAAFAAISKVANIDFTYTEEPGPGAIRIGIADVRNSAGAQIGGVSLKDPADRQTPPINDIYIGIFDAGLSEEFAFGSKPFSDLLHEIGHALGLNHLDKVERTTIVGESKAASVMSYAELIDANNTRLQGGNYGMTPLIMDIAALQALWGSRTSVQPDDTEYVFNPTSAFDSENTSNSATNIFWNQLRAIWDTDGIDTFDARDYRESVSIDLRPGYLSSIGIGKNISVAFGVEIENATGGKGHDKLIGNDLANVLDGGEGNDTLEGGAGGDTYNFKGAFGNDTVLDADGLGTLKFDGVAMPLATIKRHATKNVWEDASGQFLFTRVKGEGGSEDLRITKYKSAKEKTVQGTVTVRDFKQGTLGLNLALTAETPPTEGSQKISLVALASKADDPSLPAGAETPRLYESSTSLVYRDVSDAAKWVYANDSDEGQTVETGGGGDRIFVGRFYETTLFAGVENWGPGEGEDEDYVLSGGGDDLVTTGYGSDVIDGGDGNDHLLSGVVGYFTRIDAGETAVADSSAIQNHDLADAGSSDVVDGGAGEDWIRGGMGGDILLGGAGADIVFGMEGNDFLVGDEGDDYLYGDGVYTNQASGVYGEIIFGYLFQGRDVLLGDDGKDHLVGGVGEDQLFGGVGNDVLYGDSDGASVAENAYWIPSENHAGDYLDGGEGNDFLLGGGGSDVLLGSAGNDNLRGDVSDGIAVEVAYQGDDQLEGGEGDDLIYGDGGSDTLLGGDGVDSLFGGSGNDVLVGGAGFDALNGGDGDDTYEFHATDFVGGHEVIADSSGLDTIEFKSGLSAGDMKVERAQEYLVLTFADQGGVSIRGGIDVVESVRFADGTVMGRAELVTAALQTSDGDDVVGTVEPNSTVYGGAGNDVLTGWEWSDRLLGSEGNDILRGFGGDDVLDGGAGNDELYGADSGTVVMVGGSGRDFLTDYGSDTTYRFDRSSGEDYVSDLGGVDTVELGEGIAPTDITVRNDRGSLTIATESSYLAFAGVFHASGEFRPAASMEFVRFANGLEWDLPQILQRALLATDGDDVIKGFDGNEVIEGGLGNDKLYGNDGDDTLMGGAGDDYLDGGRGNNLIDGGEGDDYLEIEGGLGTLIGGNGNDSYTLTFSHGSTVILEAGFGHDLIRGSSSAANVILKEGISASTAIVTASGEDVIVRFSDNESMTLASVRYRSSGEFHRALPTFTFADGTVWTDSKIRSLITSGTAGPVNRAPVVATPLADASASKGEAWTYLVRVATFADPDAGDTLAYTSTLADGSALPAWLSFDAATRTFSGTAPANAPASPLSLVITATDAGGLSASTGFTLAITAVANGAPVAVQPLPNASVDEDAAFTYTVPADAFTDPDAGDTLAYRATLADGSALPSWLSFDATTRTFSGTAPANAPATPLSLVVTATDAGGLSASTGFTLAVTAAANGAPVAGQPLPNASVDEDTAWTYTVPANAFTDPDAGDALVVTATLADGSALPAWLQFNTATRTFSGTPGNGDVTGNAASLAITLRATDPLGASAERPLALQVRNVNDAPTAGAPLAAQQVKEGEALSFALPSGAFADVDAGDSLSLQASLGGAALPAWLQFDAATGTFSGLAPAGSTGVLELVVTATDSAGATASQSLQVVVAPGTPATNNPPTVTTAPADATATENAAWTYTVPAGTFTDPEGQTLVYSATLADGSALPSWVQFDAATRTFSGTPGSAAVGNLSIRVRATDPPGAMANAVFALTVAPQPSSDTGDQVLQADDQNTPLVGDNGNDALTGSWASSTLSGGSGNDRLVATGGPQNVLDGGEGDDEITGGWGNDRLIGGEGNNTIRANGASSVITAGAGNDTITGSWGDDQIDAGNGANTIDAGGGTNTVTTGSGNDVVRADGINTIATGAGNDQITTTWGADTIDAGAGDDTINAGGGNNTLRGGLGNDQFTSTDWSDDRYLFARGDGQDTITDGGGQDILVLDDVRSDQLWFTQVGNDLAVNVLGTQDTILVRDWYGSGGSSSQFHLEQIKTSDGKTLLDGQVHNLVQAMSAFAPPAAGQTTLPAGYQSALAPVLAANWQ